MRGSTTPWQAAGLWLPVYGTLIDAGCLALLWSLTRREGIGLFDLAGFRRARLARDVLLGVALVPVSLVFIFGGTAAAGWLVYGTISRPLFLGGLPLPAALYGVLIWPLIWGLTEQMTYNGYLLPRFQVLSTDPAAGTSVAACFPARIAARHTGTCHSQGVAVYTRSTSSRCISRSKSRSPFV